MFGKQMKLVAAVSILVMLYDGCTTTERITRRSQLADPLKTGKIAVLAKDGSQYELGNYRLKDSVLVGVGTFEKNGQISPFSGSLQLSDINYIQAERTEVAKTLVAAGLAVFVTVKAISYLSNEGGGLSAREEQRYYFPGGGGRGGESCPFIYSWDGNQYVLEAEAFGIALGKALELETCSILPSLKAANSQLKVQITNERPETHYFNSVRLLAIETEKTAIPVLDARNVIWPVYQPVAPICATDQSAHDIMEKICERDRQYWESDLLHTSAGSSFEDVIALTFVNQNSSRDGSLIVHAVNTSFSNLAFKNIFQFLGDESLAFMQAVENDPELVMTLRQWIEDASLKAFVWDGKQWERIGIIYPEANVAPFSRLIHFNASQVAGDTLRIRLSSLADVWRLDAVHVDWTPVQPLKGWAVPMVSAITSEKKNVSAALNSADDAYVVMLPPDYVDLTFQSRRPAVGKKIIYALSVQGYLYEWFPESVGDARTVLASMVPGDHKLSYLKSLLKHKSLLLPMLYSEWKKVKSDQRNSM